MKVQTENLLKLLGDPESRRDESWERDFLQAFAHSKVSVESDEPVIGPDGWPYLMVKAESGANESVPKILDWLSDKGLGLVLNAKEGQAPDYIFSYGMIWNYKQTGHFYLDQSSVTEVGDIEFQPGMKVVTGDPSDAYWPSYARSIFKTFLNDQEIEAPKVLVLSPQEGQYDLCFSLESLGVPPEEEYEGILEAFSWFFPLHYSLMLISEDQLPEFFAV